MSKQKQKMSDHLIECFDACVAENPDFRRAAEASAAQIRVQRSKTVAMKDGILRVIAERRKTSSQLDALIRTIDACKTVDEIQCFRDALRAHRKGRHQPS